MIIIDVEQGTPEWLRARMGRPTASKFKSIMTPKTRKPSASAHGYMCSLLAERVFGVPTDDATTDFMQRGSILEHRAVSYYELTAGVETTKVGFIMDDDGRYGCSPDRLIGEDGLLEVKCPSAAVHISALLGHEDDEYFSQCQGQMLVTGRKWVDNLFYNPALPPRIVRIKRDDEFIAASMSVLDEFCAKLNDSYMQLILEHPSLAGGVQGWAQGTEARPA